MMAVQKGLFEFSSLLKRQDNRSLLRQCHDSRLPPAIGRHEVSGPVPQSVIDSPVGRIHEVWWWIGIDATPGGGPRSPPVADDHRPVRDLADSKTPSVLCSSVKTQSSGGRCVPPALGQPSGICLSSHSHHKESSSPTLQWDYPNVEICCNNRFSIGFTKISLCFVWLRGNSQAIRRSGRLLWDSGWTLAPCRINSTRLNYQAHWGKFRQWCRGLHHRSSEPIIPKIAEFLTFLFKTEKAAVSSIKDYRAMLSSVFKFCLPEISSSPILKDLVRSFEISAPRSLHHSPPRDLDKVLEYLSGSPFEPLAEASFWNKTRKALFLLAMATAKHIGELQALSFSSVS